MRRRSMLLFASEVPVVSALNPYRQIEDVFFTAWKRTNPTQVSTLQQDLQLVVASPEDKMHAIVEDLGAAAAIQALVQQAASAETVAHVAEAAAKIPEAMPAETPESVKKEVAQFFQSEMNKSFGARHESPAILAYEREHNVVVKERNLSFFKKKVARVGRYDLQVGGKIDGRADGKVIEVKNRLTRFISPLPLYDVAQLQTYLFILGASEGELVEYLRNDKAQTRLTKVAWDGVMWEKQIAPFVMRFGSALSHFMEDRDAQVQFLTTDDAAMQKEIIHHHWMLPMDTEMVMPRAQVLRQEVRETVRAAFEHFDVDRNGAIDTKELRGLVAELGGYLTDEEFALAQSSLDRDHNEVIDEEEFTVWWMAQSGDLDGDGQVGELERVLERVKSVGRERFRVDIHVASWHGMKDAVDRLLQDDRDLVNQVDATEYGGSNTALHYAAYQGHVEMCKLLIDRGAKVNAINSAGCTSIFLASQQSRGAVVRLLLQHDADLRIAESRHQLTAIDVCSCDTILAGIRVGASFVVPSTPEAPTIILARETSLSIRWETPKERHDQLTPISAYKIKVIASLDASLTRSILVGPTPTESEVGGLKPDTEYCIRIAAINLHGISTFSASSLPFRTCQGATSVELTWDIGIGDVTFFLVEQCVDHGNNLWKPIGKVDALGARTQHVVSNLFEDQKYRFRVASVSISAGSSDFSVPIEIKTQGVRERDGKTSRFADISKHVIARRAVTGGVSLLTYPSPQNAITFFSEDKASAVAPPVGPDARPEGHEGRLPKATPRTDGDSHYVNDATDANLRNDCSQDDEEDHVYFSDDDKY